MISVVGERGGREEVRFRLGHGEDPVAGLAVRGWAAGPVRAEGVLGSLVLRYDVAPAPRLPEPEGPLGPGLAEDERPRAVRRQRVAAYAVVVVHGAVLLTQLSHSTGAPGRWNLPGGGLDPGEDPVSGVVREVAEETGQVVDEVRLLRVTSQHWAGRSQRGPEDHHAVRLLHRARCATPTRPVVHDVGGSTSDARWVPLGDLDGLAVVPTVRAALAAVGAGSTHPRAQS